MSTFIKTFLIVLLLPIFSAFGQEKDSTDVQSGQPINAEKFELTVDTVLLKELTTVLKENSEKSEKTFLNEYGTLIVAIVALLGTIITTLIGTSRSKKNLTKQLNAAEKNLLAQITASQNLEKEKKKLEQEHEKLNELKELVANFIQKATLLNLRLNSAIYYHLEEGRDQEAQEEYDDTAILRNELKSIYYSIKVTLDGSKKQKELEKVVDKYMNVTCFNFDLKNAKADEYEQPIGQLYHKIKAIIHENYTEPK